MRIAKLEASEDMQKALEREDAGRLPGRVCTLSTAGAALGGCCWES